MGARTSKRIIDVRVSCVSYTGEKADFSFSGTNDDLAGQINDGNEGGVTDFIAAARKGEILAITSVAINIKKGDDDVKINPRNFISAINAIKHKISQGGAAKAGCTYESTASTVVEAADPDYGLAIKNTITASNIHFPHDDGPAYLYDSNGCKTELTGREGRSGARAIGFSLFVATKNPLFLFLYE